MREQHDRPCRAADTCCDVGRRLVQNRMPASSSARRGSSARVSRPSASERRVPPAPPACRGRRRDCRGWRRRRAEPTARERLGRRAHVLPVAPRHVVAAEHDQIGLLAISRPTARAHVVGDTHWLRCTSVMQADPQSGSAAGSRRPATRARQLQRVALVQVSIRAAAGSGADARASTPSARCAG